MAWLIMQHGFISAVEYDPSRDRTHQLPESLKGPRDGASRRERKAFRAMVSEGFILARARVKDDLEQLREHFDGLTIVKDTGADYQWRAVMPRKAFAEWMYAEAMSIDYHSHFKEVAKERSPKDPDRYPAMLACWSQLNRMGGKRTYAPFNGPGWGYGSYGLSTTPKTAHAFSGPTNAPMTPATDAAKRGSHRGVEHFDWDAWQQRQDGLIQGSVGDVPEVEPEEGMPPVESSETDTLIGMANVILEIPLNDVPVDEFTPQDPFDLWVSVYDQIGEKRASDSPATIEEVIAAIDRTMDENAEEEGFDSIAWDEVRLELADRVLDADGIDAGQEVGEPVSTEVEEA